MDTTFHTWCKELADIFCSSNGNMNGIFVHAVPDEKDLLYFDFR